jgi:hypothetical protein
METLIRMGQDIERRVRESFDEKNSEQITKYLDWLRQTSADYASNTRRIATALILLVAAFELVANSRNEKITIGSFQIARDTPVLMFLPVIVAFLLCQATIDFLKADRVQDAFSKIFALWCAKGEQNDLDALLEGPTPLYWTPTAGKVRESNRDAGDKLELFGGMTLLVAVLIGTFAFEGQAYYVLFSPQNVLWFISLSISIFFLALTAYGWTSG